MTPRLREHLARLYPGYELLAIEGLAPDSGATTGATAKAAGYGLPVRVTLAAADGKRLELVWRVASSDEFGHDRRADRAANMLLAFDDFPRIPRHVEAIDVGAMSPTGDLISIRDGGELYLITTYAPGTIYADDLRRVATRARTEPLDVARVEILAGYLADLHTPIRDPLRYRRAIRDLVGHGEGIFGMIDGFPAIAGAPLERLRAIETRCVEWRWRLREHESRLARTHGDFHPFNVVFDEGTHFTLLDASRGGCGEPADDLTAMAINFVLFSLDAPTAWRGLGPLWHRFWDTYLQRTGDRVLLSVVPPFFAWRALVVCNPRFYPNLSPKGRDRLLGLAEAALDTRHFDPAWADGLFR
ncbi:MAG TPA: phosphotransferase [Kofleriaceae bacterium]|nr:phosphotransferase [Kofleriaceae bacterium]